MSNHDDQLDGELKKAIAGLDIPPPDEQAKHRAIAAARMAFESSQVQSPQQEPKYSQGLFDWLRRIVRNQADNGRAIMNFKQKLIYSGITAAAVGAVAVGISLQYQSVSGIPAIAVIDEATFGERKQASPGIAKHKSIEASQVPTSNGARPEPVVQKLEVEGRSDHDEQFADFSKRVEESAGVASEQVRPTPTTLHEPIAHAAKRQIGLVAADAVPPNPSYQDVGRDRFTAFEQNRVKLVSEEPVSTFSVDVDTASYSFVRRMLNSGVLPQSDAVRAEELINYFDYEYPLPESRNQPFRPTVTVSDAPWAQGRKLLHIGIKGYDIAADAKPRSNLVFLLDVSGSMNSPDKLPLVKQSMELLLTTLNPDDTVAIAVYAGAAGTVLEPTPVKDKQKILDAMRQLSAGGSTAGGQGIRLAYELAQARFDKNAINRVILATDGDFNVGINNQRELQSFIERKRKEGVFLSVLGFGQGNYHDALMQTLAQNGNGVAAYIDTLSEAQKVLVDESTSMLFPIAKDVKLQVEFNPATVAEYRLIGYETRHLNREDFNNDAVDAGDIGAGHTVTAIYEFTPVGSEAAQVEESRYAPKSQKITDESGEYAFLKIRYKLPGEENSQLITRPITRGTALESRGEGIANESGFATAVAGFAQLLKGGKYTGEYSYDDVIELAQKTRGADPYGYRTEFIQLVRKAKSAAAMQVR